MTSPDCNKSISTSLSASLPLLQIFPSIFFNQRLSLAFRFLSLGFGCCACFQGQKVHSSECPPFHKLGEFIHPLIRKTGMTVIVLQLSGCSPSPDRWPWYGCSVLKPGNAMDSSQINTSGSDKCYIWWTQPCQEKPKSLSVRTLMLAKLALTPALGCNFTLPLQHLLLLQHLQQVYIDVTYWSLGTDGTSYFASCTLVRSKHEVYPLLTGRQADWEQVKNSQTWLSWVVTQTLLVGFSPLFAGDGKCFLCMQSVHGYAWRTSCRTV